MSPAGHGVQPPEPPPPPDPPDLGTEEPVPEGEVWLMTAGGVVLLVVVVLGGGAWLFWRQLQHALDLLR